jgi:hypothetical protein
MAHKSGSISDAANDDGLLFHIVITKADGTIDGYSGRFADSIGACGDAILKGDWGAKIVVRPDIETSFVHGKLRFPESLHPKASSFAWDGWVTAKNAAAQQAIYRRALIKQIERPSELERAMGAGS